MELDTSIPLIWTTKGNLPVSTLRYETGWHVDEKQIIFRERYFLGEELVKENVHAMLRNGNESAGEQAKL